MSPWDHIFSILTVWVVATLLSACLLHTHSCIKVTGMVITGLGTDGPKKVRWIARIKLDDIPVKAWRIGLKLTHSPYTTAQKPVWSDLTCSKVIPCACFRGTCVSSFLHKTEFCSFQWPHTKKNHLHTHHLDHQMPQIYINMTLIAEAGMLERLIKRLMLF